MNCEKRDLCFSSKAFLKPHRYESSNEMKRAVLKAMILIAGNVVFELIISRTSSYKQMKMYL